MDPLASNPSPVGSHAHPAHDDANAQKRSCELFDAAMVGCERAKDRALAVLKERTSAVTSAAGADSVDRLGIDILNWFHVGGILDAMRDFDNDHFTLSQEWKQMHSFPRTLTTALLCADALGLDLPAVALKKGTPMYALYDGLGKGLLKSYDAHEAKLATREQAAKRSKTDDSTFINSQASVDFVCSSATRAKFFDGAQAALAASTTVAAAVPTVDGPRHAQPQLLTRSAPQPAFAPRPREESLPVDAYDAVIQAKLELSAAEARLRLTEETSVAWKAEAERAATAARIAETDLRNFRADTERDETAARKAARADIKEQKLAELRRCEVFETEAQLALAEKRRLTMALKLATDENKKLAAALAKAKPIAERVKQAEADAKEFKRQNKKLASSLAAAELFLASQADLRVEAEAVRAALEVTEAAAKKQVRQQSRQIVSTAAELEREKKAAQKVSTQAVVSAQRVATLEAKLDALKALRGKGAQEHIKTLTANVAKLEAKLVKVQAASVKANADAVEAKRQARLKAKANVAAAAQSAVKKRRTEDERGGGSQMINIEAIIVPAIEKAQAEAAAARAALADALRKEADQQAELEREIARLKKIAEPTVEDMKTSSKHRARTRARARARAPAPKYSRHCHAARQLLPLGAAGVTDQVHWFRFKVDAAKAWLGKGNGISVPTGSKLNKMMFLSDLLITHVGPQAKDCDVAAIEKAAGEKVRAIAAAPACSAVSSPPPSSPPPRALATRPLVRPSRRERSRPPPECTRGAGSSRCASWPGGSSSR